MNELTFGRPIVRLFSPLVVLDICPFHPTPSLLSTDPEFVLPWQWDLCEPRMKHDPHSLPFWCCLASTMTCIVHSACDVILLPFFLFLLFRCRFSILKEDFFPRELKWADYCPCWWSVSRFLQLFCSFSLLPNSCNQRLLVAFPTLLLFQKVPLPANDYPSSS